MVVREGSQGKGLRCDSVLGFSTNLLCDPEWEACPLWASVSCCVRRGLDEGVLEASLLLVLQ